jgi:hypothetical protein
MPRSHPKVAQRSVGATAATAAFEIPCDYDYKDDLSKLLKVIKHHPICHSKASIGHPVRRLCLAHSMSKINNNNPPKRERAPLISLIQEPAD